jgi:hypothetical protein
MSTPSKEAIEAAIGFVGRGWYDETVQELAEVIQAALDKTAEGYRELYERLAKTESRAAQPLCPRCGSKRIYIECRKCGAMIPAPVGEQPQHSEPQFNLETMEGRKDAWNWMEQRFSKTPLIVTKDGVPFEDQAEGMRQFKAAALRSEQPHEWGSEPVWPTSKEEDAFWNQAEKEATQPQEWTRVTNEEYVWISTDGRRVGKPITRQCSDILECFNELCLAHNAALAASQAETDRLDAFIDAALDSFRKHWPVGQETTLANPVTIAGHQDDE